MNAIIIAAGSGKRINKEGEKTPKSLVKVNEKSIIEYQLSALNQFNIENVYVITGPFSEKFSLKNVEYVKDLNFSQHDILGSLMEARNVLKNDVLVLYSDIIFEPKIIKQVLESKGDISIAVDMNWKKAYENRTEHPKSEAENVKINNKKIIKIKKNIKNDQVGEFLGIIKFSPKGSEIFVKKFDEASKTHEGKFQQAPSILRAYLTDMLQELIDSGIPIEPVLISGQWCEIDTLQDLKNAENMFSHVW